MKIVADANIPYVRECFSRVGDVEVLSGRDMLPRAVSDAEALIVRSITPVNEQLLSRSAVRFVGTATIGIDHVDLDYLERRNIGFASAPGSNANSAAEYIIAALLDIGRRHRIQLEGKSIGVVGVGNVGSRVARKCEALGMRVLRNDPPLQRQTGDAKYVPIEELYDCDFITLHTPLTFDGVDKTYHLAGSEFFSAIRRGTVFLNASRGAVVDSSALMAAIRAGHLSAVALDVWENEPEIDTTLLEMVDLGTPHIAGYSLDGKVAGMTMIYESLCRYFGLECTFNASDCLPAPTVPRWEAHAGDVTDEALLADAVESVYDIRRDDTDLRRMVAQTSRSRGAFFDALRQNYPVRREFHNTTVVLAGPGKGPASKLRGIGFKVEGDP